MRVVQALQGTQGLENSLARAESQLAQNSTIPAFYSTNVIESVINFSQTGPGSSDGYFPEDDIIPGLDPEANGNVDIAVTSVLQTTAGKMIFGRYDERVHTVYDKQSEKPKEREHSSHAAVPPQH